MNSSLDKTRETFEKWEMYDAVIRHNYMFHRDLPARLNKRFSTVDQPLAVLDLGAGDGYMSYQALQGVEIANYEGIDLSADALQRLESKTPAWDTRRTLHEGDFSNILPGLETESYDLILANYSLHHLSSNQKSTLLQEMYRVLKPTGKFVWTDSVLNEDESREAYVSRLADVMRNWEGLSTDQRQKAIQHVYDSDFPEKLSWMKTQCSALGWTECDELIRDESFGSWAFRRSP